MPQRECEDYYDNDGSVTDTMMCAKSYKGMREKSSSSDLLGLETSMNSELSCTAYFKLLTIAFSVKVLITSQFHDKILDDHFLVHKGCVIMMFYVPQEPKSGHPKFYH